MRVETNNSKSVKVLFRYFSNVLDEITVETMWTKIVDESKGLYKLDSIPFYGPDISTEDEFYAEFDETENMLTYRKTTKFSGNSIILVVVMKDHIDKENIRNEFKKLGCESEGLNEKYFAMEVLNQVNYFLIKNKLKELSMNDDIDFSEPCLSEKHSLDII